MNSEYEKKKKEEKKEKGKEEQRIPFSYKRKIFKE